LATHYIISLYEEGSQTLRHYSKICSQVRTLAIAQGLVVLGASAYLTKDGLYNLSLPIIVFGLLLTGVLWAMHENYYKHFHEILDRVIEIETKLFELTEIKGIWSMYIHAKRNRTNIITRNFVLHYGAFVLLLLSFLSLLGFNVFFYLSA